MLLSVFMICGLSSLHFTKAYCCVHDYFLTKLLVESLVWFMNIADVLNNN